MSLFLMDDQVLIEACLGCRPWESIRIAEEGATRILGAKAVNRKKDAEEGQPEPVKLVWGLLYNTAAVAKRAWLDASRFSQGWLDASRPEGHSEGTAEPIVKGTVSLPPVKLEKAFHLLNDSTYDRGNKRVKEHDLQVLGGNSFSKAGVSAESR